MDTTTLPFAKLHTSRLPLPYASIFGALVAAHSERGIGSTAAETSRAIEGWFELLGMLALAEYLDAGAPDAEVNRLVFALLERRRPPLTGQWVAVARGCLRALQHPWNKGRALAWPALAGLDLGEVNDDTHPVSRLLRFRNTLSHGTFLHDEQAVLEHGRLLEFQAGVLLTELIEKPISFEHLDGRLVTLGDDHSAVAAAPSGFPPFTPFVQLGPDLRRILAPALHVHEHEGGWILVPGRLSTESSDKPLFQFESALHQFRREQRGHVQFGSAWLPESPADAGLKLSGLDRALAEGAVLTLIEYRPVTGQRRLAAQVWQSLAAQLSHVGVWRVILDHPGASGKLLARVLLRWAEDVLQLAEGSLEPPGDSLPAAVAAAAQRLSAAGRIVGVILMDAAVGLERASDDDFPILDLCKSLDAGGGLRIFLLAQPSYGAPLPHDGPVLRLPLPAQEAIDREELGQFVERWRTTHREVSDPVLAWLLDGEGQEPQYLSEALRVIAERLEAAPFPAAIEHALWTAAPILQRSQGEDGRLAWSLPGGNEGAYAEVLRQILACPGESA